MARRRLAALRFVLRKRYELIEITTHPVWRDYAHDRLSQAERVVSRHWFRFSARQAHIGAREWYRERLADHCHKTGRPLPVIVHMIKIID